MKKIILFVSVLLLSFNLYSQNQTKIIEGLKEALLVGAEKSILKANIKNGYFLNPKIKIPFPKDAERIEKSLKKFTVGKKLMDTLTLKLNRAAEDAAYKAKPIFINAVKNLTLNDATGILKGPDNAATLYLKSKTYNELVVLFKPVILKSLNDVSAQKAWNQVMTQYNKIPFHKKVNTDLAQYTTTKALDGLFLLIAEEEANIRKNPAARVNDILKNVFNKF